MICRCCKDASSKEEQCRASFRPDELSVEIYEKASLDIIFTPHPGQNRKFWSQCETSVKLLALVINLTRVVRDDDDFFLNEKCINHKLM